MNTTWRRIYGWIDDRVQISDLVAFMGKKYVPIHRRSMWYYFGGVTLFLFVIQVVTGILLLLYYKGSDQLAFRKYPVHHVESAVRMADPVHPQLVGKPLHPCGDCSHVQRLLRTVVPETTGTDLDHGDADAVPRLRVWFQRLPASLERARLFCDEGGDRHRRRPSGHREAHVGIPSRRG